MAKTAMFWLNAFPAAGGASQDLSLCTILTGQQVDYKRHCHYQFGEYTQTHEEHNNSMNPRMVGAIALRPVRNGLGSFYFLGIATGRVLKWLHATALPMSDGVIDKLHRMARQQKSNPALVFADHKINPDDDDDDDDETYHDNDNSGDEDEEELSYNEEDDDEVDENEEAEPGPPAAGDEVALDNDVDDDGPPAVEDGDDDDEGQADMQPSAEVEQPPGIPPGEAAGAKEVDQDEEHSGNPRSE